jgi:hypothetical protein
MVRAYRNILAATMIVAFALIVFLMIVPIFQRSYKASRNNGAVLDEVSLFGFLRLSNRIKFKEVASAIESIYPSSGTDEYIPGLTEWESLYDIVLDKPGIHEQRHPIADFYAISYRAIMKMQRDNVWKISQIKKLRTVSDKEVEVLAHELVESLNKEVENRRRNNDQEHPTVESK